MKKNLFDLTGRTAIVTGGRRGLGQAMAKGLNDYGANVAVVARTDEFDETMSMLNKNSMAFTVDIKKDEQVRDMVKRVEDRFGAVDIMVNNAGLSLWQDTFKMPAEEFTDVVDTNILGTFLCSRSVYPGMKKRKWGRIINIASVYGMVGIDKSLYVDNMNKSFDLHSYTASKGGVINLTRDLANYWGRFGINVNAISPGMMVTKLQRKLFDKEVLKKLEKRIPMNRVGDPSELVGAAVFLSSEASSYVNGCNLVVDGGWVCW